MPKMTAQQNRKQIKHTPVSMTKLNIPAVADMKNPFLPHFFHIRTCGRCLASPILVKI
ncbi:hypothetical protein JW933_04105 [candidate division FCPU426 bacterium]|nr:hypothetical protein [candidate division FCPU426 bacterium]